MNTINNTFTATYTQTQQFTQSKSDTKNIGTSTNIEVDTLNIEYTKGYDLENITPQETYALANELYENDEINVYQLANMFIVGFKNEFNAVDGQAFDASQRNNEPFNLMEELNSIASKTMENHSFHPIIHENIHSLIETLLSLPDESLKIEHKSIDVSV